MDLRDRVVDYLEHAAKRFYKSDKTEESDALMGVVNALRDMPAGLADDLLEEITVIVKRERF